MDRVGLVDGEDVHVWAVDHTARIETYAFAGPSGTIGLNGGAAQFFRPGDKLVIAAFALTDEPIEPKIIYLGDENEILGDMTPFSVLG
jgi:aspartate 1-decarboxylase